MRERILAVKRHSDNKKREDVEVIFMTREDVKKLFPDATDEQITALLNQNNSEVVREKTKAERYKEEASKVSELEKQLDEINKANMTDIEKANAERDTALNSVKDLESKLRMMEMRSKFAEKGIVGEDADKLLSSMAGGNFDFEVLGKIISDRESAAAIAKEKEIAGNAGNPNGGNGSGDGSGGSKPADVENAESISFGTVSQNAQATRDLYK